MFVNSSFSVVLTNVFAAKVAHAFAMSASLAVMSASSEEGPRFVSVPSSLPGAMARAMNACCINSLAD